MTAGHETVRSEHPFGVLRPGTRHLEKARGAGLVGAAVLVGVVSAYLLTAGLWFVVLALVFALPGFVLIQRAPLAAIGIWLIASPFLTIGAARPAFWAVHRALPIVALLLLFTSDTVRLRTHRLSRLGWPEVMIASYVVVTAVSALYTSDDAIRTLINLYDRVVVPVCLYLLLRLVRPTPSAMRRLGLVAVFVIVTQAMVGTLQWAAPSMLPSEWLGRAGTRTTGSLLSPAVFGVTLLAAGVFVLHVGATSSRRVTRTSAQFLFALAVLAAVMSLTRAVWLAALVVVIVVAMTYPRQVRRLAFLTVLVLIALVASGAVTGTIDRVESRYNSDQTALGRLPIAQASVRMFEQKPLTGWGYGNFDKYDRDFQREVNGVFPEKDLSSHNLYLTLLAEQGILGAGLYLGVAIFLAVKSVRRYSSLPRSGLLSRKLLLLLWALLASHIAVNNFSNMRLEVGLGQWWLLLGLVGALVTEIHPGEVEGSTPRTTAGSTERATQSGAPAQR